MCRRKFHGDVVFEDVGHKIRRYNGCFFPVDGNVLARLRPATRDQRELCLPGHRLESGQAYEFCGAHLEGFCDVAGLYKGWPCPAPLDPGVPV